MAEDSKNPYAAPSATGLPGANTSDHYVEYEFTLDDLVQFSLKLNYGFQETTIRRRRRLYVIIAIIAAALDISLIQSGAPWILATPLLIFALVFIYRATFFSRQYRHRSQVLLRKMLSQKPNRSIVGHHTLTLTDEGLEGTGPGTTFTQTWWSVVDVERADDYVHLYMSSTNAHSVPARAFVSPAHFDAFADNARRLWEQQQESH